MLPSFQGAKSQDGLECIRFERLHSIVLRKPVDWLSTSKFALAESERLCSPSRNSGRGPALARRSRCGRMLPGTEPTGSIRATDTSTSRPKSYFKNSCEWILQPRALADAPCAETAETKMPAHWRKTRTGHHRRGDQGAGAYERQAKEAL